MPFVDVANMPGYVAVHSFSRDASSRIELSFELP
jgi:hypothetical protein